MVLAGTSYLVLLGLSVVVSVAAIMVILPSMISDIEPYTIAASSVSLVIGLGILWYLHIGGFLGDLTFWPPEMQAIIVLAPTVIGIIGLIKGIVFWD